MEKYSAYRVYFFIIKHILVANLPERTQELVYKYAIYMQTTVFA